MFKVWHHRRVVGMRHLGLVSASATSALLGAGVSVDAGLPTAYQFGDALIDALVRRAWAATELKRLMRLPRPDARDLHDALRFESLISWIVNVFGDDLGFFDILDAVTEPGLLHLRFASMGVDGAQLVTPNFDGLLERALLQVGASPWTLDASRARGPAPAGTVPVVKLHGTRQMFRGRAIKNSSGQLLTTIESIASENPGTELNRSAAGWLHQTVDGRVLVVAGYSGSDDLDIVPTLAGSRPSSVIWIDHAAGRIRRLSGSSPRSDRPPWMALTSRWLASGIDVEVLRGPTMAVLDRLGVSAAHPPGGAHAPAPDWRGHIQRWAGTVRHHDVLGLGFAGLVFGSMDRHDLCLRAIRESRGAANGSVGWTSARRDYELAQVEFLAVGGSLSAVRARSRRAERKARATGDTRVVVQSLLLQGRACSVGGDRSGALDAFGAAEAVAANDEERADIWSWIGRTHAWYSEFSEATPYLRKAIRVFRRIGDLSGLLDSLEGVAVVHGGRGDFDKAIATLREVDAVAALTGSTDRRCTAQVSMASTSFDLGRLAEAKDMLRLAFDLAGPDGNDEISEGWMAAAEIAREEGDLQVARAHLRRAWATTSEITEQWAGELSVIAAQIALLDGRTASAVRFARTALDEPPGRSSWRARATAAAIVHALDRNAPRAELREALVHQTSPRADDILHVGIALWRLGIDTPDARRLVLRARRLATRAGATRWCDVFDGTPGSFLAAT